MHDQCVSLTHNHLLSPPKTRLKASSKSYWKYLRRDIEEYKRVEETNKHGVWLRKCICFTLWIFTCIYLIRENNVCCQLQTSQTERHKVEKDFYFFLLGPWLLCYNNLQRYDPPNLLQLMVVNSANFSLGNSMVCTCDVMWRKSGVMIYFFLWQVGCCLNLDLFRLFSIFFFVKNHNHILHLLICKD